MSGPKRSQRVVPDHVEGPATPQTPGNPEAPGAPGQDRRLDPADFSPDMLVELATDGRLVYANRAVQSLIGRTPESVIGSSFLEFIVPDDRERNAGGQ